MTIKGRIHNGVVTLEEPSALANGTEVEVRPLRTGAPEASRAAEVEQRFQELARQWKDETLVLSSITAMATHPAYQQIIGMGKDAVPLILAELKQQPAHWFWALRAITGEDPVPPQDRG